MKEFFKKHMTIIIGVTVLLVALGAVIISQNMVKKEEDESVVVLDSPKPYEYIEEVTGKEKKDDIKRLKERVSEMASANSYFQINNSEDSYQIAIFNPKGQGFVQDNLSGNISIFRGDNKSILYTDSIDLVYDINVMQMLDFGLDLVEDGTSKIYKDKVLKDKETEEIIGSDLKVRYLDIVGYDDIGKLYSKIDESLADIMVTNLKENTEDSDSIALRFIYVTGNNGEFSAGCNVILGDEEYSNWNFDGYIELKEWELGDEWFEYNYENTEDTGTLESMLENLARELDDMMHEYAEENNLDDVDSYGENVEDGHYHEDGTFHTNDCNADTIIGEDDNGHYHEDGTYHQDIKDDNPIIREDDGGHYHEDGTYHQDIKDDNPIIREDDGGHYHEDGTFHSNN